MLLWGPDWNTVSEQDYLGNLEGLAAGLGHEPQDTWSTILSQYTDGTGFPAFFNPVYMGVWNDTSTPPNLPFMLDAGTSCGEDFVNSSGIYDGLNMVFGHEYAETVTDPDPYTGWVDQNDPYGGEIGDKCAWGGEAWGGHDPYGNVLFWTGNYAMQSLWNNASGSCTLDRGISDQVSVTSPGNQASLSTQQVDLVVQGSSSGGNQLELHATGLPPGLGTSASGNTLAIRGEPAGASGIFHVTIQTADTTGSVPAPTSFTWTVLPVCTPKVCP
jgi:hypothetical protein